MTPSQPLYYLYDSSFEGLLTAVFDLYFRRESPARIVAEDAPTPLFTDVHTVVSDPEKAERVLRGLKGKISASAINMLYMCHLSELPDVELLIVRYIQKALASPVSIEVNFGDDDVLALSKIRKKVSNERTFMLQFVRFQKTVDGVYFAVIEPRYNVLPICLDFFRDRYSDQQWLIYDACRHFGAFYNRKKTELVHFQHPPVDLHAGTLAPDQQDDREKAFQELWREYLQSITHSSRKNLRLQRQLMPRRFWRYLVEKQG
jgi:probable DNA metabolism protein